MGILSSLFKYLNSKTKENYWLGFVTRDELDDEMNKVLDTFTTVQSALEASKTYLSTVQSFLDQQKKINNLLISKMDEVCKKNKVETSDAEVFHYMG